MVALMLICGKMAAQQVTLDFSTNGWNLPTTKTTGKATYSYKGYAITLQSGIDGSYLFEAEKNCLVLGTKDATITLPAFDFPVSKIEVVGGFKSSKDLLQNIFVGDVAVSSQTTGYDSNLTNTFVIDDNYQVAGTAFTLKVLSSHYSSIQSVKVYKVADGTKKSPALQFSTKSVDYVIGDVFKAPTFTKQTTAQVTFSSSNENVATVDANGVISVTGKAAGTVTITAKAEANNDYRAGTATCTINVTAKETTETYKKVTTLVAGKKYLIVAKKDNKTYYSQYIDKLDSSESGYMPTSSVEGNVDEIKVAKDYTGAYTIEATAKGYSIKDSQNRYLGFETGTSKISATPARNSFTIEPQSDGTFKIAMVSRFLVFGTGARNADRMGSTDALKDYNVMPMLYMLNDSSTGISNVPVSKKATSDAIYNLAGQRVGKDYKGIVIINGKKTVQK